MQTDVLDKLRYVDDMVENAKTEKKMQETIDQVPRASDNLLPYNQHNKDRGGSEPASTWELLSINV